MRGFVGLAMYYPKKEINVGTLIRTCHILGVDFMSIIGRNYQRQSSDTNDSTRHIPLFHYSSFDEFLTFGIPRETKLIGVEITPDARYLETYKHHERAIYLLGPEDGSLPEKVLTKCSDVLKLRGNYCFNLAVAGSIVLYDRTSKEVMRP